MKLTKTFALSVCVLALCFTRPLTTAAAATWQVVVSGLDNPRGLAFGPEGGLYIAQAGRGGDYSPLRSPGAGLCRAPRRMCTTRTILAVSSIVKNTRYT